MADTLKTLADDTRRTALYELLCASGDRPMWQAEIYDRMTNFYPPLDGRVFHDSTARTMMSADISAINRSTNFEKIIISTRRGIKIATREEAREMISHRYAAANREYLDLSIIQQKFERDGQSDVDGGERSATIGGKNDLSRN